MSGSGPSTSVRAPAGWITWARVSGLSHGRGPIKLSRGGKHDLNAINRGTLRHPLYGNRRVWVAQSVEAGTYDKAFEKHAEQALPEVERVLDDIMREIQ